MGYETSLISRHRIMPVDKNATWSPAPKATIHNMIRFCPSMEAFDAFAGETKPICIMLPPVDERTPRKLICAPPMRGDNMREEDEEREKRPGRIRRKQGKKGIKEQKLLLEDDVVPMVRLPETIWKRQ